MNIEELKKSIRNVPDFPIKGIQFKDITTLLKNPASLQALSEMLYDRYKNRGITKVLGVESRGFIIGAILAEKLGAGFIPIRKPGKLPAEVIEEKYKKEYGFDSVQMHRDALDENDVVLIHDDLLATGGTLSASCRLVRKIIKTSKIYINVIIELEKLKGRDLFDNSVDLYSLIKFDI